MSKRTESGRLEVVKRALRHWDPIGVIESAQTDGPASDEYDSYASRILALVESDASARDIAFRLVSIRVDSMTLGARRPTEHEEEIGGKLAHWRDTEFKDEPDFRFMRYAF